MYFMIQETMKSQKQTKKVKTVERNSQDYQTQYRLALYQLQAIPLENLGVDNLMQGQENKIQQHQR